MPLLAKAFAATLVALMVLTGPADAHAALESSNPRNQQVLPAPPDRLRLTFSEDIERAAISVIAPDGKATEPTHVRVANGTVTAAVDLPDQRGEWTLAYRAIPMDGHPLASEIMFTTRGGRHVAQSPKPADQPADLQPHRMRTIGLAFAAIAAIALILAPIVRRD